MEWQTISIPKGLGQRIERILAPLSYPSISAFIQEAIRIHLNKKEREVDEIEHEREVGRKVLGKDDPVNNDNF